MYMGVSSSFTWCSHRRWYCSQLIYFMNMNSMESEPVHVPFLRFSETNRPTLKRACVEVELPVPSVLCFRNYSTFVDQIWYSTFISRLCTALNFGSYRLHVADNVQVSCTRGSVAYEYRKHGWRHNNVVPLLPVAWSWPQLKTFTAYPEPVIAVLKLYNLI